MSHAKRVALVVMIGCLFAVTRPAAYADPGETSDSQAKKFIADLPAIKDRLTKKGLGTGMYSIVHDISKLENEALPASDVKWQNIRLRVPAVEAASSIEQLIALRAGKAKKKEGVPLPEQSTLIEQIIGDTGKAAEPLAKESGGVSEGDPKWDALGQRTIDIARPIAAARLRLAYFDMRALRMAIEDLSVTFPERYTDGKRYLDALPGIEKQADRARQLLLAGDEAGIAEAEKLFAFQREALLANPLLDSEGIVLVKRAIENRPPPWAVYGSTTDVYKGRSNNELAVLEKPRPDGQLRTLYRPNSNTFVGHIDLHWDADRVLYTDDGQVAEIRIDGSERRLVVKTQPQLPDAYCGSYLPDGGVVFCSTAGIKGVPCVDGKDPTASLLLLEKDGKTVRRLTFDQDHDWYPRVLHDGRIMYTRWDYTDAHHYYARLLFAMNPDGTSQFALYGSNSYFPNGKFYTRQIPHQPNRFITVEIGHVEESGRCGNLMLLDREKGQYNEHGVVQQIPGYGKPVVSHAEYLPIRNFTAPRFMNPWPLADANDPRGSGKYFLAACRMGPAMNWAIYLVDIFDNMVLLREEAAWDLTEPIAVRKRTTPPVIPDRVKPESKTAQVYLADVYAGEGLKGVPRGTVKALRVYAYHFCYQGIGGHYAIGLNGPWDARRILGTVPVYEDGSASFIVPANTPVAVQPLDEGGQAVQIMRSWYTAMPGENASCIGCHERYSEVPVARGKTIAAAQRPVPIAEWYGPARPFSFDREVQPMLDTYCVSCHNAESAAKNPKVFDLRSQKAGNVLPPDNVFELDRSNKYKPNTFPWSNIPPAYRILQRYVRRPALESDYIVRNPGEYHAGTSPLIQMLRKGHHGVQLDAEAWDRFITWIDLNVPCFGTWTEVAVSRNSTAQISKVGDGIVARMETDRLFGGPSINPEEYPKMELASRPPVKPVAVPKRTTQVACDGWPMTEAQAKATQAAVAPAVRRIEISGLPALELVAIPPGNFVMGDAAGNADESPQSVVRIAKPFWMARTEVTNQMYAASVPQHDSGYQDNFGKNNNSKGRPLNLPEQPAIRVSWREAVDFCAWLSAKSGVKVRLPSEAEWEYACRAGRADAMNYGSVDDDFGKFENLADKSFLNSQFGFGGYLVPIASKVFDPRFDDGQTLPEGTGAYKPHAWGLHDMHGNVAEWTSTIDRPYPYDPADGRESMEGKAPRIVRGGSWADRPKDSRSAIRRSYVPWQRVHNVGIRVVVEE